MARRQRRRIARPKPPNLWVILFQILVLIGFLVAILAVTDTIGDGTGALFESLTSEDLQVGDQDEEETSFPGGKTEDIPDDGDQGKEKSEETEDDGQEASDEKREDVGVDNQL